MMIRWMPIALVIASLLSSSAAGATFRVTTRIFAGANVEPSSVHHVLFENGLVFDLPQIDSRFVTVYDPGQNLVTLLDRQTQVRTAVRIDDLVKITAAARAAAVTKEQKERLGINATVQASKRVIGHSIQFGKMEYHITTQKPDDPSKAADYGQFAILASRLNIVRRLGPPPFGRMTLSDHVTRLQEVPLETTLTLKTKDAKETYRSTHELGELTSADRQTIAEVRGMMALYKEVAFAAFPK